MLLRHEERAYTCIRKRVFIYKFKHMKMGAGIFWGAFLLLLGVALIVKVVFNVDFPVFKVLIGIFLVLLGLKVIFGKFLVSPQHFKAEETVFSERVYDNPESGKEYTLSADASLLCGHESVGILEEPGWLLRK